MSTDLFKIWNSLNSHLKGFIIQRVKDPVATEDILQDVFLKFQTKIDTLKDESKLTSWIFQITRNAIIDYYRDKDKSVASESVKASDSTESDDNLTGEFSNCIIPMIDSLPEKYRNAVMLSEIEGMSQKKLAEELNISYSGAKSRVQRGREQLKSMILKCCDVKADKYGNIIDFKEKNKPKNCD